MYVITVSHGLVICVKFDIFPKPPMKSVHDTSIIAAFSNNLLQISLPDLMIIYYMQFIFFKVEGKNTEKRPTLMHNDQ